MTKFKLLVDNEEKVFTGEEIIEEAKQIIRDHTYMKEEDNGTFTYKLYVDPYDGLNENQIKEITSSNKEETMMDTFFDMLHDFEMECRDHEESEILSTIESNWNEEKYGEYFEYEDFIREWVYYSEDIELIFPFDHFLNTEVQVNLVVDTGDGNYDFTLNNFLAYNGDGTVGDESSIKWLIENQGYTMDDFKKAYEEGTDSKFLKSVIQELENCTSHMNALSFFVSMSLKNYIKLQSAKAISLDTSTNCGLMDYWMGAGSVLEIALEKPIELPMELVEAHVDGNRGYGVDEVYGMFSDFWKESISEIHIDGKWQEL